ncbi:MAG: 2,3-bisphosphoglycerate-independent phosphoglycerate mutase [Gammaproteobacteria bacterium]|nr:MAG: 2,3-bisphosphoglycerate-independent phosphoglycerate mutase [Gammaproteobacteria bacterium]
MNNSKNQTSTANPLVLMILDGWGAREDAADNAVSQADTPCWDQLNRQGCHTTIEASGASVGLPVGQMGNSEVGHMNIGAGRVVYQDYTRINTALEDGSLAGNPALCKAIHASRSNASTLHIMGLLSPGGVHSHEDHFLAIARMAAEQGAHRIRVHAFLDGRDTPPRSAGPSIGKMQECLDGYDNAAFGIVCGRYYAMDRDRRWDRVQKAWDALVNGRGLFGSNEAGAALQSAYDRGEDDEFVSPTVINGYAGVENNDAVIFINFRSDRAREISQAFTQHNFSGFLRRQPRLSAYVCMTQYQQGLPAEVAFPPEQLEGLLGESFSEHGLAQLRIAETEKYAHVTFFFNGGEESPFPGEQRLLVPSPRVATYDLQPEMSVERLSRELDIAVRSGNFDVIICNVANPDMVGHTGSLKAAVAAVEAVDACLATVLKAIQAVNGELLITADHGNVEQMTDHKNGQKHTAHTTNPVPFVYYGRNAQAVAGGALKDIAPTMLYLLGITPPPEMTGHSLLKLIDRVKEQ